MEVSDTLSLAAAADRLGISTRTLERRIAAGDITYRRPTSNADPDHERAKGERRIPRSEVERLLSTAPVVVPKQTFELDQARQAADGARRAIAAHERSIRELEHERGRLQRAAPATKEHEQLARAARLIEIENLLAARNGALGPARAHAQVQEQALEQAEAKARTQARVEAAVTPLFDRDVVEVCRLVRRLRARILAAREPMAAEWSEMTRRLNIIASEINAALRDATPGVDAEFAALLQQAAAISSDAPVPVPAVSESAPAPEPAVSEPATRPRRARREPQPDPELQRLEREIMADVDNE
jgi:hypothetical protein